MPIQVFPVWKNDLYIYVTFLFNFILKRKKTLKFEIHYFKTSFLLAKKTCFKPWKLEYQGYHMAEYHGHPAGTQYTCMGSHPDTLHRGPSDKNGYLFYLEEVRCGSLKCPPYVTGRDLTWVVCFKELKNKSLHNVPGISIKQLILSYRLVAH